MGNSLPIKAGQIRAARALLDWSQEDLAKATGLSIATIRKLEAGHISPRGKTTSFIRKTFEDAGLEFLEPNGVRQRLEEIKVYQGHDGLVAFLDGVYETARKTGCEILTAYASEEAFPKVLGPRDAQVHLERMSKLLAGTNRRKAVMTETPKQVYCTDYCAYRVISKNYIDTVPFYVYDDKYAYLLFEAAPSPKIIEIQSKLIFQAFRRQFYSMWDKATPINPKQAGIIPEKVRPTRK